MMRSRFDEQLAQLHRELIEMGALCERAGLPRPDHRGQVAGTAGAAAGSGYRPEGAGH